MKAVFIASCALLAVSVAVASPLWGPEPAALADDVIFNLYTVFNPDVPHIIRMDDFNTFNSSFFEKMNKTKIVIHGYTENIASGSIQDIKNAYMRTTLGYNVIGVDWGKLAAGPIYNNARNRVVEVGTFIGLFIDFLIEEGGAFAGDIHALGYDLGAHVAGVAGFSSKHLIARATGLDPIKNGFETELPDNMINPMDAKYVDIIHTDSYNNFSNPAGEGAAFWDPLGDADFYMNGGVRIQSGCGLVDPLGACSHSAAYVFYSYSIENPNDFDAHHCNTLGDFDLIGNCDSLAGGLMGEGSVDSMRGIYRVRGRIVTP